jgi:hypothetical protein
MGYRVRHFIELKRRNRMDDTLKTTHFKAMVESITVWMPSTYSDEKAEEIIEELEALFSRIQDLFKQEAWNIDKDLVFQ